MPHNNTILFVGLDPEVHEAIVAALPESGLEVSWSKSYTDARHIINRSLPLLVIVSQALPNSGALAIVELLREQENPPPVIWLADHANQSVMNSQITDTDSQLTPQSNKCIQKNGQDKINCDNSIETVVSSDDYPLITPEKAYHLADHQADSPSPSDIVLQLGVYEYLQPPVDLHRWQIVLRNSLRFAALQHKVQQSGALDAIVGQSLSMRRMRELISQIAHTDVTVLIQGESGTGKELIANAVQALSQRADAPFVKVNVAALSPELVESELFGHERGAFSGAIRQHFGRFELANGGTLFLDEIGEMRLDLQVKLLRVLQERTFERVGGLQTLPIDIRLIAATNRDLRELIAKNQFREDLYYRINVVRINAPSLREHPEDIPLLTQHFLRKFGARYDAEKTMDVDAVRALLIYPWPGNIRELEHAIESAVVRTPGTIIRRHDLPEDILGYQISRHLPPSPGAFMDAYPVAGLLPPPTPNEPQVGFPPGLTMEEVEKRYILSELRRLDNNKTQAAKSLSIGLKTLYRKLDSYGEAVVPD